MAPPLFWEAPPSPGGRSRNSGRGLSRPLCSCCRRRARARSSSRSRSPAAGLSRPGCRRQLAVSGGGPGAWGPGAREGRAQGEARAERPRERDWGESRRRRGRAEGTAGSPGGALRSWHEPTAGCTRPSGGAWAGVPGPPGRDVRFRRTRVRASVRAPRSGPEHLRSYTGAGSGWGDFARGATAKPGPGPGYFEVCSKMIVFWGMGWRESLLALVFPDLKLTAGLLSPAIGDFLLTATEFFYAQNCMSWHF